MATVRADLKHFLHGKEAELENLEAMLDAAGDQIKLAEAAQLYAYATSMELPSPNLQVLGDFGLPDVNEVSGDDGVIGNLLVTPHGNPEPHVNPPVPQNPGLAVAQPGDNVFGNVVDTAGGDPVPNQPVPQNPEPAVAQPGDNVFGNVVDTAGGDPEPGQDPETDYI